MSKVSEERLRRYLFHDYLENGINTDDELEVFVKEFMGFTLPRNPAVPTHSSPFEFLSDMFFERERKAIVMASRNSSKTRTVSILNFLDAFFKHIEVGLVASTLDQSDKGYRYLLEYLKSPLVQPFVKSSSKGRTVFTGGGEVEIHTGTIRGLNSGHPNKLAVDEVELIPYPILEEGFSMTTVQKGLPTRDTLISSRKKTTGTMQRLIDSAEDMNYKVYVWNVFDVIEKCPRLCHDDPVFGDCPAWSRCQGKAHDSPTGGFMPIQVFIDKATTLTDYTWKLQWLCEEASEQRLVYNDDYVDNDNFISWDRFLEITGYDSLNMVRWSDFEHFAGIDVGHVFVYNHFVYHKPSNKTFWVWEYYSKEDRTLKIHADIILKNPYCSTNQPCLKYIDPSAKQEKIELEAAGVTDILLGNNSRATGTDVVKMAMRNKEILIIKDNVTKWREEIKSYAYPTDDDGKVTDNNPEKNNNDHSCFIGTTPILTEKGPRPIKDIEVGDLIYTRLGFQPVLHLFKTEEPKNVITLEFSDRIKLTCTPDHPIMTVNGFKPAGSLEPQYDIIYPMILESKKIKNLYHLPKEKDIPLVNIREIIWTSLSSNLNDKYKGLIGDDVRVLLDLFQSEQKNAQEIAFCIIKCLDFIYEYQHYIGFGFKDTVKLLKEVLIEIKNYLKANRLFQEGDNGIKNTIKLIMINIFTNNYMALSLLSGEEITDTSFHEFLDKDLVIDLNWDEYDLLRLFEKAINKQLKIQVEVKDLVTLISKKDSPADIVYNLNVRQAHEYFANGVLVSNCDALRYGIYSRSRGEVPKDYSTFEMKMGRWR